MVFLRKEIIMSSEKKCLGCGVLLQDENILQEGYTTSIENDSLRFQTEKETF